MNEARRVQLEVFRSWPPGERLRRGMELTELCVAAREARLKRQHPQASPTELRALRLREVLDLSRRATR